jgi:hypothetical protein
MVMYGAQAMPEPAAVPADWVTVRLPGCPVQLGLQIGHRLNDLIRDSSSSTPTMSRPRRASSASSSRSS